MAKAPASATPSGTQGFQEKVKNEAVALQKKGGEACVALKDQAAALQKQGGEVCVALKDRTLTLASATKDKAWELAKDPRTRVTAASAAVGGATIGTGGAAVGVVTGGTIGAACGIPFALFTFGLSVPVSAMIGGGVGLVTGGAVGTTAGATTGGAVGFGTYTKRAEIKAGIEKAKEVAVYLTARAYSKGKTLKKQVLARIGSIRDMVEKKVRGS